MDIFPQCFSCILDVRFKEILNSINDRDKAISVQYKLLNIANEEFSRSKELTHIASNIYLRLVKEAPEIVKYYKELKRKSIDTALNEIKPLKKYASSLNGYEKFRFVVKVSIAGNLLDLGVSQFTPPSSITLDFINNLQFGIDNTYEAYNIIRNKKILYLFDNAGEAVYDTLLIETLKEMGNEIVGVVKEEPGFQNDLTIEDARYLGLTTQMKIITTGYAGSSIHLENVNDTLKRELNEADIIISKGMANFEYIYFMKFDKPVLFLLVPKCEPVAIALNTKKRLLVALLRKE
ncbi:MAG: ARMT1-like domain-containing protein [Sulfolobaceae archaeon]|nr:ARMT1-like domain-containing protein [Sulfolobaceae archaeon]